MLSRPSLFFGPFRLDLATEQLWRGTQLLSVRPKTFAVLRYLVEHPHRLVTREELCQAVWPETVGSERAPKQCIRELRHVLGDEAARPRCIETLGRRGWRFIAPLTPGPAPGRSPRAVHTSSAAIHAPLRTPSMVGRARELARLYGWLEKARQGERQVVFVTGEPGIGKTAVVEALLSGNEPQAADKRHPDTIPSEVHGPVLGLWSAWGQCIEQHGAGEPFLPLLEALGHLARGAGGAHLLELLRTYAPMWLGQLPAFIDGEELESVQRKVQGASRQRMLREFTELVEALTTGEAHGGVPLLLVLEDLHWSDVSTLDLLAFLARRRQAARLLVVGTYRPVEMLGEVHPLQSMTQELYAHRLATELPLGLLSEADIAAYLEKRLSGGTGGDVPLYPLARLLHHRTGGNPLFLVSTVDDLLAQGLLTRTDQGWTVHGEVVEVGIAETIRHLLARQCGRLSAAERQTLAAASVAGLEFSAATVAAALGMDTAEVERRCRQLADRQQFLRRAGIEEWRDGTLAGRYGFVHALYQHFWHERVSPTHLQSYHRQIGERKERAYGDRTREIAAELAVHFEQGREYRKALQYLQQAGQKAVQRSANVEAISHLTKGLALLKILPDMPERAQQELRFQIALGAPLLATKGYAAPEVGNAYTRALELGQQIGETLQLLPVLWGLWQFYIMRTEFQTAYELGEQLLTAAQRVQDSAFLVGAHQALGVTLFHRGELAPARAHLEQGAALYDPQQHSSLAFLVGQDPGVACRSFAALTLWLLGYPEQAVEKRSAALALAQELSHPFSQAFTGFFAAWLSQFRREGQEVHEQTEASLTLSREQGFAQWLAMGPILQGWALAKRGQGAEGIAQMQQGLAAYRATETELERPYYLALLAEAYGTVEQFERGLSVLAEALAVVDKTGERSYEAELYRLRGQLTLQAKVPGPESQVEKEAEGHFLKAIEIARRQQAKSLELRAVMSLRRLWQQQGKQHEAHQMLAEIYNWFTEGFDTKDLQEAKTLLEELN